MSALATSSASGSPSASPPASANGAGTAPSGSKPAAGCAATRTLSSGRAGGMAGAQGGGSTAPTAAAETARTEPAVECIVVDDDNARIEELRVRGQTQRIVVRPKDGSAPYEIQLLDAGRDPSAKSGPGRGGTGQRVWPVLAF